MDLLLLAVALAVILLGAELFTNGIEWFGHRLNLAEGAVGSVLAAVATAMPETLIPVIAIVGPAVFGGGSPNSTEIGVGAILGAPFMLATLAMFVTGLAIVILARRGSRATQMSINVRILGRDVIFFVVAYTIAIGTAFLPADLTVGRWAIALALVAIYAFYVRAHFTDPAEQGDASELNRLHLTRLTQRGRRPIVDIDVLPGEANPPESVETPALRIIITQVVGALALIIVGAQVFVGAVEHLSGAIGLDPRILALVIAPIATELPEKFNSVIWVRTGKDTLAMGNITGAMVFQSCLPTVLGILFTEWTFQPESALAFASAGAAFIATFLIFGLMLSRGRLNAWSLLIGGPIYLAYVAAALLLPVGTPPLH
ncbi:MAG TPA: sodium:calcium antiporter [Candidatus Limnocylindria bacterium]|nr:sodium:calcium antiporter [Candidatus Limnocylindria bacterium]